MNEIFNHLWQSTAFAAAAALAVFALRRNSPRLRYWLWLATSMKFLIPFSLLVSTGARVQLPPDTPTLHAVTVQQISSYFAPISGSSAAAPVATTFRLPFALALIWLAGVIFLLVRWLLRWRTIHRAARTATRLPELCSLRVLSSPSMIEPGVFGFFRPVLLLPEGIQDNLTPAQFEAVLAHELRHIHYCDNLTAALHMCVETLFWFHPLVWWIGAKLMEERERDCDEAVLTQGSLPGDYARGIVQVCAAYVESPLACASGISGSDLKTRIREIMTWRGSLPVTYSGKAALVLASLAALSIPFAIGILRAQTLPPPLAYTYEVASVRPAAPGQTGSNFDALPEGRLRTRNTSVEELLTWAYNVPDYRMLGAPGWVSSDRFDIILTPDKADGTLRPDTSAGDTLLWWDRARQRLQAVLRDRFGLVLRTETRELPVYTLVQAPKGARISQADSSQGKSFHNDGRGHVESLAQPIEELTRFLSRELGRPVTDETGLKGQYDFKLDYLPDRDLQASDAPEGSGQSIFTALTDQLGLRLQSKKAPVVVYVVEKIHQPTEN